MTLYYAALVILWCSLWGIAAIAIGKLPENVPTPPERRIRRWSIAGVCLRLLPYRRLIFAALGGGYLLVYVASHAPTLRAIDSGRIPQLSEMLDFYVPVEWLIDETPLRGSLLSWADVWGERQGIESASAARRNAKFWGDTPAWLYGTGWLTLGVVCVLGPAWFLRIIGRTLFRAKSPSPS